MGARSRKAKNQKQRLVPCADELKDDVRRLERSLNEAQQRIKELEGQVSLQTDALPIRDSIYASEEYVIIPPEIDSGGNDKELPPRQEVLSAVNKFLSTLNSVLPLFHPQNMENSINRWYDNPESRETSTWAAINVVLALTYRQNFLSGVTSSTAVKFLNNAQAVLSEVLTGEPKLLDVQTLIGMVLFLQTASDLKPATTLMAIALRLAHSLGLHIRSNSAALSSSEMLERDRVFWIAYICDRDIAMRTRLPPLQNEKDIGIDWPSANPVDDAGLISTSHGAFSFNFFLSRVQLAHIQGQIYEATQAPLSPAPEAHIRLENVVRIHRMLDSWYAGVPPPFLPGAIVQAEDVSIYRPLGVLYASHLSCRSLVCKAHAMEWQWLRSVQDFGRKASIGIITSPHLPVGWTELVDNSRQYMKLFTSIEPKDPAFYWMTVCTYISGAVCLTANNIFNPWHEYVQIDDDLIMISFRFLENTIRDAPSEPLQRLRDSWEELLQHARARSAQFMVSDTDWLGRVST
ncbi:hypothetical protein KAF25_007712 [Fusarium avenaceum]|uniref:Xylanolytic transcriptional activator regulatory domain-containing protein n=1 Tax=Fusarium avenaceum TaxID=40199 RepID=A0A9P7GWY9_9HYPO|nr:hypothetical protein KAF25_007712 [Fusarium avenaceum]